MYETYYEKLQLYFGEKIIPLHYMDTGSFLLRLNSINIIKDSQNLNEMFDFSKINENHGLCS